MFSHGPLNHRFMGQQFRQFSIPLLALIALAAALRLPGIKATPPWYTDEGFYVQTSWNFIHGHWATFGLEQWTSISPFSPAPPFYYLLLGSFLTLFGKSIIVARLVSAVVGIATVWSLAHIGRQLFSSSWVGLIPAAAFAVLPEFVINTRWAFPQSLAGLLLLWAFFLLGTYRERQRLRPLILGSACLSLAMLTIFWTWWFFPVAILLLFGKPWRRFWLGIGIALVPALLIFVLIFLPFVLSGTSDAPVLAALLATGLALQRRRWSIAAGLAGLAVSLKAFAWVFLPVIAVVLVAQARGTNWTRRIRASVKPLLLGLAIALGLFLPFILWDTPALYDVLIRYVTGRATDSYPIMGIGFSGQLRQLGIVGSDAHLPFWVFQLSAVAVFLGLMLPILVRRPTVSRLFLVGTGGLFLTLYFGRHFHTSYAAILLFYLTVAFAWRLAYERPMPAPAGGQPDWRKVE